MFRNKFSRNKFSRVNDLKLKFGILPVKLRIEKCCVKYLGKFIRNQLPAFQNLPIAEHSIKHNDRTKKLYNNKTFTNNILGNSFFHKTITWWNQLPLQIRSYTISNLILNGVQMYSFSVSSKCNRTLQCWEKAGRTLSLIDNMIT